MANTLRFKRGLASGIPTALAGEPLFTTDTFDLYIGNGTTNTRFQKYIASGATTQILRGDGSLYTFPLAISSPSNGQVLKYNGTSWVNDSDAGITGSGSAGQVAYFTGATTQAGSNNLFWDNTNARLGINTNTPSTTLYVRSAGPNTTFDSGASLDARIEFRRNAVRIGLLNWDSGVVTLQADSGNYLGFNAGGSERARIFATGNFGINTGASDNGAKLQVNGTGYFSDVIGIGTTAATARIVNIGKNLTGSTISYGVAVINNAESDVTSGARVFYSQVGTVAAAFLLNELNHYYAVQGTFGAGSTVTNQFGFRVYNNLIGATNNYGFYGDIAAATGRWNLYMNGTANNYMAGSLGIGSTAFLDRISLKIAKNITGATTAYGIENGGTIQSDVTSAAYSIRSLINTQATTFTLANAYCFDASQGTLGAGSTVTNLYGFFANSNMVGATNNYGFYGNIAAGTGRWNLYMNGTANNYMAGSLGIGVTVPSYKLDVQGTSGTVAIRAASSTAGDILYYATGTVTGTLNAFTTSINATGSVAASLQNNNTATGSSFLDINVTAASTGDPYLSLTTSGATNWSIGIDNSDSDKLKIGPNSNPSVGTPSMTLDASGNLGLGTASPSRRLSVVGTTDIISYSNGTTTGYLYSDNNGVGLFNGATATGTGIYARTSNILDLYYNGSIGLRLNNLGRVLIGSTTDSGEQFQVNGTAKITGNTSINAILTINTSGQSATISSRYGSGSDGFNIWIGGGGASSGTGGGASFLGSLNTSIGIGALQSVTTGYQNTSIGRNSLVTNTTGYNNTAIGSAALNSNTTGHSNSGIGLSSLFNNTSGNQNIGVGSLALNDNTTGNQNVGIGVSAGYGTGTNANTTGANNIFIGYQSVGVSATESNRTWIGNSSTTSTWLGGNLLVGTTTNLAAFINIGAATTAKAQINMVSGTAPTAPNNGDIWFDGTDLKMRIGGVTKTFTLV